MYGYFKAFYNKQNFCFPIFSEIGKREPLIYGITHISTTTRIWRVFKCLPESIEHIFKKFLLRFQGVKINLLSKS